MVERIRQHLGEIWAASAVAAILSSVAAGMLLFSDQVIGCTGPVKLVSLDLVERRAGIDLPEGAKLVQAAVARPHLPVIGAVVRIPRAQVDALLGQTPLEETQADSEEADWVIPFWEEAPNGFGRLPVEIGDYRHAQTPAADLGIEDTFVPLLVPSPDPGSSTVDVYAVIADVYRD